MRALKKKLTKIQCMQSKLLQENLQQELSNMPSIMQKKWEEKPYGRLQKQTFAN